MTLCPAALFALAWAGGSGISAMKLSRLQSVWETKTWLCFFLIAIGFFLGWQVFGAGKQSSALIRKNLKQRAVSNTENNRNAQNNCPNTRGTGISEMARRISNCIFFLTALSYAAFLLEAALLGYVPLFTTATPHAYSYFHISGVHYFTVSCVLVPSLFVLRVQSQFPGKSVRSILPETICTALCMALPLLLVSRFQLLFGILLAFFTWLLISRKRIGDFLNRRMLLASIGGFCLLVVCYIFLTVERAHSISYLNGIFEMKNPQTPIWFTQPYIYIANNFDNFNCLVRDLPRHTYGLRMLFPFFALTGLKFAMPSLAAFPLYVTKEELTTVTLFYDAYYDFGMIGAAAFAFLLGALLSCFFGYLEQKQKNKDAFMNPLLYLIGAQLAFYCLFAFFTTWYSNPATWFYLALSAMMFVYTGGANTSKAARKNKGIS